MINQRTLMLIFYLIIMSFGTGIMSAQQQTLKGKVVNIDKQPVEFVEAVLLKNDTIYVEGAVTDSLGYFSFKADKGNYRLVLEYFGEMSFDEIINLNQDINIGEIKIDEGLTLEEITITARKKLIEKKVDRLIFNVGESVYATGGNAMDALKASPRVNVQNEEVSMTGKGQLKVMINDKILLLSGKDLADYLKTLKTEDLERIEIITNPPAKYSAEGDSGLINIVSKQADLDTWNVSLRSGYKQATHGTGNIGGSFNVKKGKFQLLTSIDYTNGSVAPQETNQVFYPTLTWHEVNNRRDYHNAFSGRMAIDYDISDKVSTGVNYKYVNNQPLVKNNNVAEIFNVTLTRMDSIIITPARSEFDRVTHSLNYYFLYKIDSLGRKLSLDVDFFDFDSKTNRQYNTQTFYTDNPLDPVNTIKVRNYGIQNIKNYSANLDMEHPFSWATFNYGVRASFIKANNLFNSFDYLNDEELLNPALSNRFNYEENTYALYFSAQKSFAEKWQAKLGLRLENTYTEGYSETLNQTTENNYAKLFPTAYLVYTHNDDNLFSLNYGRRISRPNYDFLNPFTITFSPYSYAEGNPFLQPAFTDNFELEYVYKNKWIASLYYSFTDDLFGQVTFLDAETNTQRIFPENYIKHNVVGFYQSLNLKPLGWWKIATSSNVSYNSTESKIPEILQELNGWNASLDVSNDFTLNSENTLFLNVYFYYVFNGVANLHTNTSYNQLDLSVKWLVLDERMTLSLHASDVFSSNRPTYTTYSNDIKTTFRNYYDQRALRFSLIYNFGKKIDTSSRQGKNQEELNRTQ